jgi:5'-deoxynucleotidase
MRLYGVKRWNMVETTRAQSVAEHTFGVVTIAMHLAKVQNMSDKDTCSVIIAAQIHDLAECMTGDIPTPVKDRFPDIRKLEYDMTFSGHKFKRFNEKVKAVVKQADMVEAFEYLRRFGVGEHAEVVKKELYADLCAMGLQALLNQLESGTQRQLGDLEYE